MEDEGDGDIKIDQTKGNDTIEISDSDSSLDGNAEISDDTKWKCENCQLLNPEQVMYISGDTIIFKY